MDKIQRLDQWIDTYTGMFPFSGIVRISKDDEMIYERCVGLADREWNIPVASDTRFRLYSMTKPFTALSVMKLVDQGKVDLDAHPGRYVPLAKDLHPGVTVRNVLSHNSGLPDFAQSTTFRPLEHELPVPYEKLFECVRNVPMNNQPGEGAYYSNFNFFIASLIVEEVTGREYDEYLQHEVFDQLGMADARVDGMNRIIPRRAKGYSVNGMEIVGDEYPNLDSMKGAGNGIATAKDVYQLNRAIKNRELISKAAWDAVLTPAKSGFGLGMGIMQWHNKLRYTHNGGHHGFRTLHVQLPEDDFDLILLSNMGFGNARNAFAEAVYSIWYGEAEADKAPEMDKGFVQNSTMLYRSLHPARPDAVIEGAEDYAGRYESATRHCTLTLEDGRGELLLDDVQRMPVYYIGDGVFQHALIDESYGFPRDSEGVYTYFGMKKVRK